MNFATIPSFAATGAGAATTAASGAGADGSGRSGAGDERTTPDTAGCSGSSLGRIIVGNGLGATGVVRW